MSAAGLVGCAEPAPVSGGTPTPDAGMVVQGQCMEGQTQACPCNGGDGVQNCVAGFWNTTCDCSAFGGDGDPYVDPGPTGMRCKGGYYTGSFTGRWRPGAFDLGGGLTLIDVQIDAKETEKGPGLALTLEEKIENEDSEFPTFEVKNGCVTGTATAIGGLDSHPFVATLSGELDCGTGKFEGVMDGVYSLFDTGELSQWYFINDFGNDAPAVPFSAQFVTDTESLEDGMWDLREKQTKPEELPGSGGEGVWDAKWESEESPPLPQACQDFINGLIPGVDAGTPPPAGDAGT